METQMNEFTEMASKRYQRAWRAYEAAIRRGGSAKLSSYCESVHVNYEGMKHWVAARGLSVRHLRRRSSRRKIQIEKNTVGGSPDMFVQFMPPTPMPPVPMCGVKIDFPDGVTLTLRECSPEGIVALLDAYERRRSAREAAECSR
jgi:hypothetical protein